MAKTVKQLQALWKQKDKQIKTAKTFSEKSKLKAEQDAIHAQADSLRGFKTATVQTKSGKLVQSPVSIGSNLPSVGQATRLASIAAAPKAFTENTRKNQSSPSTYRKASGEISVSKAQQEKNSRVFLNELKSNQGGIAAAAAGFGIGLVGGGKRYLAPETKKVIESTPNLNKAFTGGQIAGSIPGFAAPYGAASKGIGAAVTKFPIIRNMGKLGQAVTKSVATDLAVGLPLNVNYAVNTEGLKRKEAAQNIALNTGIDLITGGVLEAVPVLLKSGKKVSSKAEFDVLPATEKTEVAQAVAEKAQTTNPATRETTPVTQQTLVAKPDVPKRDVKNPEISFDEYAKQNGVYDKIARDTDFANYIGGSMFESTKAGRGKLKAPKEKIDFTNKLYKEYTDAINNGKIETVTSKRDLNLNSEADQAHIRMQIKRAEKSGDIETANRYKALQNGENLPAKPESAAINTTTPKSRFPSLNQPQETTAKAEGLFTTYHPEQRAADTLASTDFHSITKEASYNPEDYVTVYHGTAAEFDKFDKEKQGLNYRSSEGGFFFTNNEKSAGNYAKLSAGANGGKERVIAAQLDMKNPLVVGGKYSDAFDYYDQHVSELLNDADNNGNDGIIVKSVDGKRDLYVAFEPDQVKPTVQTINSNDMYAAAKGQREVPRTITPNELPRANKVQPQPLPQAPTKPVQPILPQKGTEIPKEQPFAKNEDLRNNFSQAHGEKFEADYNNFMKETEDLPDVQTGASEFAQRITSKGTARSKDIQRNADSAFRNSPDGRRWFKQTVEDPLYRAKGEMATGIKTKLDNLYKEVVQDLGIKKGSKESAAVQWYGEGQKQRKSGKDISTETTPYTLDDLKTDFGYTMANGKKAWENIVLAESKIRTEYTKYVDRINEALIRIYPNVEADVAKLQTKLSKAADQESRKAILKEIDKATVGKRLYPRKDYFRHFKEQNQGFLVGLDNVINGATNIDPNLIGVSEFTKPKSKWTGFLQHRKDGDIYTEDAVGGLLEYIPQAEYKINIEPNIPVLRSVIKELKESTTESRNANSFIDELMQITNDLAGKTNKWDRNFADFFGDEKGRKVLNTLSSISNRMRKNAVIGNANSMIAQFFNLPNVVGYAKNPIDLADGFKTSIQASMGDQTAKELLSKSDFLRERYIDRSFRQFNEGLLNNTERFFSWTMEVGDKAIADGAWLTFYRQAQKKGLSEQQAIRFADEFTRKSVGGRGVAEMPLSQKAKVTKMFAPFQVEVRNAVNVLKDLGTAKDVSGIVGVFVTSFLLNEALKATTGREIGFNPIGTVVDSIQDGSNVGYGLAGNALTNMPGGSYIASAGANALGLNEYQTKELFGQNDPSRFGTGNIALQTLAAPIGQAMKGQNIDLLKPLATTLPKFGGKQLERSIRGLQDMAVIPKEKVNLTDGVSAEKQTFPASYSGSGRLRFALEPSVGNYITAPTLGTWSTPEGKAYVDSKNQTLSDKKTFAVQKMAESGVDAVAAEKLARTLPKKVTDQRSFIFNTPLSAAQKNVAGQYLITSERVVDYSSVGAYKLSLLSEDAQEKYNTVSGFGVGKEQFVETYNATKDVTSDKDDSGKTIYLSESYNKKQAIDAANPTATKAQLRALYNAFDVSEKVWQ